MPRVDLVEIRKVVKTHIKIRGIKMSDPDLDDLVQDVALEMLEKGEPASTAVVNRVYMRTARKRDMETKHLGPMRRNDGDIDVVFPSDLDGTHDDLLLDDRVLVVRGASSVFDIDPDDLESLFAAALTVAIAGSYGLLKAPKKARREARFCRNVWVTPHWHTAWGTEFCGFHTDVLCTVHKLRMNDDGAEVEETLEMLPIDRLVPMTVDLQDVGRLG